MFKYILIIILLSITFFSFQDFQETHTVESIDSLRKIYSDNPKNWPKPQVDSGIVWKELGILPSAPIASKKDSLKDIIALGKMFFFDPRLSGSNQISCSSCHAPDLSWTDGKERSVGHNHLKTKRNAPSLLNIWYFKKYFWDGRASSLEEQALGPLLSEGEMNENLDKLPQELNKIKGYKIHFKNAFGKEKITKHDILKALAIFQQTLVSRKSKFDEFLSGKAQVLNDKEILGLHLFRTKARCINCHNGPLFSDNQFHNVGLTFYGREYEDLGLYNTTKKAEDVGKFKTPILRDIIRTRPWMHNGLFDEIEGVVAMYNNGMPQPKPKDDGQRNDPLFPKTSPLIKKLNLSKPEQEALIAFLGSITSAPFRVQAPELPQ
ncbi:MAG: cytochrome-c peroxidase [Flectobacillus sp.]|uniref:cytochrome-c peroxidase n=1 Tax=Flectobacillus sp. TaxID=50419 RepID=UPI003B9D83A8